MFSFTGYKAHKGRTINPCKPVRIYRNLHRNCYSIQQDRLVIGHCESFLLERFSFLVNENGRRRVIREGKKNVHAYVVGYVCRNVVMPAMVSLIKSYGNPITYNPYKYVDFVYKGYENHIVDNTAHTYVHGDQFELRVN